MVCPFCGEDVDPDDLLHELTCSGRQGQVEADLELHARQGDPETSHEAMRAYDRARMRSAMHCVATLYKTHGSMADFGLRAVFEKAGTAPCCDDLYQQARSSARDRWCIVDTGERRVNPETGRRQVVWAVGQGDAPVIQRCELCGHVLRRVETASA